MIRIAISCEMDFMASEQRKRSICNMDYIEFVIASGYSPYLTCPGMDVKDIADGMDGLLLTGGRDISPMLYGADLEWNGAKKCNIVRDVFERDLYEAFVKAGKPVFGICRGFQLIVIFAAGNKRMKLEQDINKLKSVSLMHQQPEVDIVGDNPVHMIECRGVLQTLVGEQFWVNSSHHQGFIMSDKTTDTSWIRQCEDIFAWARSRESAYILEAFGMNVKNESGKYVKVAGVQYHPERMFRREPDHMKFFQYTMGTIPETEDTTTDLKKSYPRIIDERLRCNMTKNYLDEKWQDGSLDKQA